MEADSKYTLCGVTIRMFQSFKAIVVTTHRTCINSSTMGGGVVVWIVVFVVCCLWVVG